MVVSAKVRRGVAVVVGAGAVYAVFSAAGGLGDAIDALDHMQPGWIVAGVVLAIGRIELYGAQLRLLTRNLDPPKRVAWSLGWVVYGFGAITPAAPAEGLAIAATALRRNGASTSNTAISLGFSEWFAQRTFYAVAALNLLVAMALGRVPIDSDWAILAVALFVLGGLAITQRLARNPSVAGRLNVIVAAVRARRRPHPPAEQSRADGIAWHAAAMRVVGRPMQRVRAAALSAGAVVLDGGTLWCMAHGAGLRIGLEVAILAATAGTVASWIPLLPGGLGVVEAAIPAVLHASGSQYGPALAATLTYRAAGTLLPAVVGAAMVVPLRGGRSASTARRDTGT